MAPIRLQVSIPFIAGQWSLQGAIAARPSPRRFQSPSLRGSGRFTTTISRSREIVVAFQSPSLRGSGRFQLIESCIERRALVSIPFIAGQWSLQEAEAWAQKAEA